MTVISCQLKIVPRYRQTIISPLGFRTKLSCVLFSQVTAAGFEPLLKFAYTSKLLFGGDNVADIRRSASVLGFRDLEDACFDFLVPRLSGGDGPTAARRKTCCEHKCKRRLWIEEAGTGSGDATRGGREPAADSSAQQETAQGCGESANSKMESRSGGSEPYRQCPKYRRQLACEREICSGRQSLPAASTEDDLRDKEEEEEEEERRESSPSASSRCRSEDHERGPEITREERTGTDGDSAEMRRDPRVTERSDADSAFLGSSFMLAEGSSGSTLNHRPLKTLGEARGPLGEERVARHPTEEKPISPWAEEEKETGGRAAGVEGAALSLVDGEVAGHPAQRPGSDRSSPDPGPGTIKKPPEWLDLHLEPQPSSCSFRDQNRCPWSGAELSEWEASSFNSGEDGDSGTETEGDSESYTRERAKEVGRYTVPEGRTDSPHGRTYPTLSFTLDAAQV